MKLLLWIQAYQRSWLTSFMRFMTRLGDRGHIWLGFALVCFCLPSYRVAGQAILIALAGALILGNLILKNLCQRMRPFQKEERLSILVKKPTDSSFPSCHTLSSVAVSLSMYQHVPPVLGKIGIATAVLISLSRLYLCVHYLSDILVGAACGILISWGIGYFIF